MELFSLKKRMKDISLLWKGRRAHISKMNWLYFLPLIRAGLGTKVGFRSSRFYQNMGKYFQSKVMGMML